MHLYLVRHAVAHARDRDRWPQDSERPLTRTGSRSFLAVARGLATVLPRRAALLTSPLVRARQTAEILASVASLKRMETCEELAAGRSVRQTFDLLGTRREQDVVVVGHEPGLSRLMAVALGGKHAKLAVEFEKGGAARLDFPKRVAPHHATLVWMLPPDLLRDLG